MEPAWRRSVIVVVSLHCHLQPARWGPWLSRLGELLEENGVLLFSTLGMHAFEVDVPEADRGVFRRVTEGFLYNEANETGGRLSSENYGTPVWTTPS